MLVCQNSSVRFSLDPALAELSLQPANRESPAIQKATFELRYHTPHHFHRVTSHACQNLQSEGPTEVILAGEKVQQIHLKGLSADGRLAFEFVYSLPASDPFFIFQLFLTNVGSDPIYLDRLTLLHCPGGALHFNTGRQDLGFFSNGWQSWSFSGVYGQKEWTHRSFLGPFRKFLLDNPGTPQPHDHGHFSSDFFGILGDRHQQQAILAGFFSQREHFGSLETRLHPQASLSLWANGDQTRLDPGKSIHTDRAVISFLDLEDPEALAPYTQAVAKEYQVQPVEIKEAGWCSWYYYFNHVTAKDIEANMAVLQAHQDQIPLQIVQIDDGFEKYFGNWFSFRPGFPDGVKPLAQKISAQGLQPGLWLAPFMVNPKAELAKKSPHLLLRNAWGLPAISGATGESLINYALDCSNPEALAYACQVIRTAAKEWGFSYLKLDFLSAGALAGKRFDPTRSRAQILRAALEALRQAAGPETRMMACGVPLGSAIGLFEAARIGDDVSPAWEPEVPYVTPLFRRETQFPATRNALRCTLNHAFMHNRWWANDPDCMLARPDSRLTPAEVETLATVICLSGGTFLLSDALPALENKPETLRLISRLLPPIGKRPWVLDWFESATPSRLRLDLNGPSGAWSLIAYLNWSQRPAEITLNLKDYKLAQPSPAWAFHFWSQTLSRSEHSQIPCPTLAPHGIALYAIRPIEENCPQYLGSDLHISQGLEVKTWEPHDSGLSLALELNHAAQGKIYLSLPLPEDHSPVITARESKEALPYETIGKNLFAVSVAFDHTLEIDICY